jgi:hypothetical protein
MILVIDLQACSAQRLSKWRIFAHANGSEANEGDLVLRADLPVIEGTPGPALGPFETCHRSVGCSFLRLYRK